MLKVIVLLAAGSVWLLTERHSLSEKMTILEGKIATVERQRNFLDQKVAVKEGRAVPGGTQRTWLQDRIDSSRSRLHTSDAWAAACANSIDRTYPSGPNPAVKTYPYGGTTVIRQGNTTINNYVSPLGRSYVPALSAPAKRVDSR